LTKQICEECEFYRSNLSVILKKIQQIHTKIINTLSNHFIYLFYDPKVQDTSNHFILIWLKFRFFYCT